MFEEQKSQIYEISKESKQEFWEDMTTRKDFNYDIGIVASFGYMIPEKFID